MCTQWRGVACLFTVAVWLMSAQGSVVAADPDGICSRIRPLAGAGYSTVLKIYAEAGIRCPTSPWTLQFGWRYTQLEATTNPFVVLTYDTALSPEWHLFVTGSEREHIGDYEVNRLPEITVEWAPALPGLPIVPTIDLSAAWITTILPLAGQTTRVGTVLTLSSRPLKVSTVTLTATYQIGGYTYATGQTSSYWQSIVSASVPLSPAASIGVTYQHQEGFGASPLLYDFVGYDNYAWTWVTVSLGPKDALSFAAQLNINVPGYTDSVREYTLTYTRVSEGWSIGIGYYAPTKQPFLLGTIPQ